MNPSFSNEPPHGELSGQDVSWLALAYVCNELSAADCEAFEQQLLDDQLAREAVAAAVEECSAIRLAFAQGAAQSTEEVPHREIAPAHAIERPVRKSGWQRAGLALSWMLSGAAACWVAITLISNFNSDRPGTSGVAALTPAETAERQALAQAYIDSDYVGAQFAPWSERDMNNEVGYLASLEETPLTSPADLVSGEAAAEPSLARSDDWMLALAALDVSPASSTDQEN